MAHVLHLYNDLTTVSPVTADRYWKLLYQYARQHTASFMAADTSHPPGSGHFGENLHPDQGYWNTRQWRWQSGAPESTIARGDDYFHSSYIDLVIGGLFGLRASPDIGHGLFNLTVSPIVAPCIISKTNYFALDGVRAGAHDISVLWDVNGQHYGKGVGLLVLRDGEIASQRSDIGSLTITLSTE